MSQYTELSKPIEPENAIGRVSRMDAINNKSIVEAALREAQHKLNQLETIEKKINDADFGNMLEVQTEYTFWEINY